MMDIKHWHMPLAAIFGLVLLVSISGSKHVSEARPDTRRTQVSMAESSELDVRPVNDEAQHNFEAWSNYVRATSDDESEPWGKELDEEEEDLAPPSDFDFLRSSHHQDADNDLSPKGVHDSRNFKPTKTIVVAKDGSGDFTTIQAAVHSVPNQNKNRVLIKVKAGIYNEKVKISRRKRYITMEGELDENNKIATVVTFNNTARDIGPEGLPLKTFGSATFAVNSKNFIARDMIFQNTAPTPKLGEIGGQAVALRVTADKVAFYNCRFYGKQDTLYDHKGRHYYKNCYVEGTVDFVFGNARSLYEDCHLHALANHGMPGAFTAQKRNATSLSTGFSISRSLITGTGVAYLGRAWGNDSRVVFSNTFMDKVVIPAGWNNWGLPDREKSVFYAQYNCSGPGAHSTGRVHWARELTFEEAKPFLSIAYINGRKWLQNPTTLAVQKEGRSQGVVGECDKHKALPLLGVDVDDHSEPREGNPCTSNLQTP